MDVRFWGTRGSIAKPGPSTIRYGGNTSCVEVRTDGGTLLVLDCGTGAHELARQLSTDRKGPLRGSVLIGHTHWDHIQGIPFFGPFFVPGDAWDIYAPQGFGDALRTTLAGQMEYTYFPITPDAFGASIHYHNVSEGEFRIGDAVIRTRFLNHPALTVAYRIEADGAALVYACDHEPHSRDAALGAVPLHGQDEEHARFMEGADLVIHDAQYTAGEYPTKVGWGHSTWDYAISVCRQAGVRRLALTHHDPMRDDQTIDTLLEETRAALNGGPALEIVAAAEGMTLRVEGSAKPRIAEPDRPAPATGLARTSRCVLVITQSDAFLGMAAGAVGDEGLETARAGNVAEALAACAKAFPPLFIVDGALPKSVLDALTLSAPAVPMLVIGGPEVAAAQTRNIERIAAAPSQQYLRSRVKTWLMRGKYGSVPAAIPETEARRLAALRSTRLLDTLPEERFDRLTRIAAKLFDVPTSLFTLVDEDRQWFKSRVGLEARETPRHMSFCSHAILEPDPFVVHDALQDDRFATNPLVVSGPRIRFYAGMPVHVYGEPVGTLCLIDAKPKVPSEDEIQLLRDLAALVQSELAQGGQR